jgi:hypothetical protein
MQLHNSALPVMEPPISSNKSLGMIQIPSIGTKNSEKLDVLVAKAKITEEIQKCGIKKDITIVFKERKFKGRSTEIIVKKVGELIAKHNLSLSNSIIEHKFENSRFFVVMKYTLTSAIDGSFIDGIGIGVGDNHLAEKAVQNGCTYAFKHFLTQTFFIAEGEDEETEEAEEKAKNSNNARFLATAIKIKEDLINAFTTYPEDLEYNQALYRKDYLNRISHPAFPENIRQECFKIAEGVGIKNSILI